MMLLELAWFEFLWGLWYSTSGCCPRVGNEAPVPSLGGRGRERGDRVRERERERKQRERKREREERREERERKKERVKGNTIM